jgi:hypothetical protein
MQRRVLSARSVGAGSVVLVAWDRGKAKAALVRGSQNGAACNMPADRVRGVVRSCLNASCTRAHRGAT